MVTSESHVEGASGELPREDFARVMLICGIVPRSKPSEGVGRNVDSVVCSGTNDHDSDPSEAMSSGGSQITGVKLPISAEP